MFGTTGHRFHLSCSGPPHRLPVQRDADPGRESGHFRLAELIPTDDEEQRAQWQRGGAGAEGSGGLARSGRADAGSIPGAGDLAR